AIFGTYGLVTGKLRLKLRCRWSNNWRRSTALRMPATKSSWRRAASYPPSARGTQRTLERYFLPAGWRVIFNAILENRSTPSSRRFHRSSLIREAKAHWPRLFEGAGEARRARAHSRELHLKSAAA